MNQNESKAEMYRTSSIDRFKEYICIECIYGSRNILLYIIWFINSTHISNMLFSLMKRYINLSSDKIFKLLNKITIASNASSLERCMRDYSLKELLHV